MAEACDYARRHGYVAPDDLTAECVRLKGPGPGGQVSPRNFYRTRYDHSIGNSLLGIGNGANSFAIGRLFFTCENSASLTDPLNERRVRVASATDDEQLAASLVHDLYWRRRAHHNGGLQRLLGRQLEILEAEGVLEMGADFIEVSTVRRDDWVYYEKLLYPASWWNMMLARLG